MVWLPTLTLAKSREHNFVFVWSSPRHRNGPLYRLPVVARAPRFPMSSDIFSPETAARHQAMDLLHAAFEQAQQCEGFHLDDFIKEQKQRQASSPKCDESFIKEQKQRQASSPKCDESWLLSAREYEQVVSPLSARSVNTTPRSAGVPRGSRLPAPSSRTSEKTSTQRLTARSRSAESAPSPSVGKTASGSLVPRAPKAYIATPGSSIPSPSLRSIPKPALKPAPASRVRTQVLKFEAAKLERATADAAAWNGVADAAAQAEAALAAAVAPVEQQQPAAAAVELSPATTAASADDAPSHSALERMHSHLRRMHSAAELAAPRPVSPAPSVAPSSPVGPPHNATNGGPAGIAPPSPPSCGRSVGVEPHASERRAVLVGVGLAVVLAAATLVVMRVRPSLAR